MQRLKNDATLAVLRKPYWVSGNTSTEVKGSQNLFLTLKMSRVNVSTLCCQQGLIYVARERLNLTTHL
jgi:hypothetical protein